jgi:hypothetical protein
LADEEARKWMSVFLVVAAGQLFDFSFLSSIARAIRASESAALQPPSTNSANPASRSTSQTHSI